eukprot:UC4_evm4s1242
MDIINNSNHVNNRAEGNTVKQQPSFASRRILRDLRNFTKDRPTGIWAGPKNGNDSNIFEWDVVIEPIDGPMFVREGPQFAEFPEDYPSSPLNLKASTYIPHPNCFSRGWICLDLLQGRTDSKSYIGGWNPAYEVRSILLNVQSFLFDWWVPQNDYSGGDYWVENLIEDRKLIYSFRTAFIFAANYPKKFSCVGKEVMSDYKSIKLEKIVISTDSFFEHRILEIPYKTRLNLIEIYNKAWPQQTAAVAGATSDSQSYIISYSSSTTTNDMSEDILNVIFSQLKDEDLWSLSRVCRRFEYIIQCFNIKEKRYLKCFYTKESFENTRLGFGATLVEGKKSPRKFSMDFDLLSSEAFFEQGANISILGSKLDYWIPAPLNKKHCMKIIPYLEGFIGMIVTGNMARLKKSSYLDIVAARISFQPAQALQFMCTIMNLLVVQLMNQDNVIHHSENALLGYISFHHILLVLAHRHPEMVEIAEDTVEDFIANEGARCKVVTPDLGKFIILITILPSGTWKRVVSGLVKESFDRNVKWLIQRFPDLAFLEHELSQRRIDSTLEGTKTSLSLLMFQAHFINVVEPSVGESRANQLEKYWASCGRPKLQVVQDFQKVCSTIMRSQSWHEFHYRVGLKCPDRSTFCNRLKSAVKRSAMKGYHFCRIKHGILCNRSRDETLHERVSHCSYRLFIQVGFHPMRRVEDEMLAMARQFSPFYPVRICADFQAQKGLIAFVSGCEELAASCINHLRRHGFSAEIIPFGCRAMKQAWFNLWKTNEGGAVNPLRWYENSWGQFKYKKRQENSCHKSQSHQRSRRQEQQDGQEQQQKQYLHVLLEASNRFRIDLDYKPSSNDLFVTRVN